MPSLEEMDLRQCAIVWRKLSGRAGYTDSGEAVVASPEEIAVRWVEGQSDALKPDGTTVRLDGRITTDQDIPVGSQLWLAPNEDLPALDQWYESGSSGEEVEVMTVEALTGRARSLCGKHTRREYGLVKYMGTPSPQE